MVDNAARLAENLEAVRQRIAEAARRVGRAPEAVNLVAVTKYVGIGEARALIAAGCLDLGESRPQELQRKAEQIADPRVRWHLIGHLQRNKVRQALAWAALLHSIDSLRLLEAINEESRRLDRRTAVLLEVKISVEAAKQGFSPDEMPGVIQQAARFSNVEIRGLMGMASLAGGEAAAQRDFARLSQLRTQLQDICPPSIMLAELSMGMSGDLEAAIAAGATIVRVGSALFEDRVP